MSDYLSVATHSGAFHADEVTAIALLKVFMAPVMDYRVVVLRTRYMKKINEAHCALDVGGVYDPEEMRFDHHQASYRGILSSAGMVLQWLNSGNGGHREFIDEHLQKRLAKVFIDEVDAVDNGLAEKRSGTSYSGIISSFNSGEQYGEVQDNAFHDAVCFAIKYIENIRDKYLRDQHDYEIMKDVMDARAHTNEILELPEHANWEPLVYKFNGEVSEPIIKRIVWPSPDEDGNVQWFVQVPNVEQGAFELNSEGLPDWNGRDKMVFVHKSGFIGAAWDKETAYKLATHNIGEE